MALAAQRSNRRRHWIVDRPFQWRFVQAFLLVIGTVALLILGGVYLALWVTLSTFELQHDPITVQLFKNVALFVSLELFVCLPLLMWILTWMCIMFTHTVAGPLVRILSAMKQMTQGKFDIHVRLRKGDALDELAEAVNQLASSLHRRP